MDTDQGGALSERQHDSLLPGSWEMHPWKAPG